MFITKPQIFLLLGIGFISLCTNTFADSSHYDYATVIDVDPIVERERHPVRARECWNEEVSHNIQNGDAATEMIMGGIIGGVVANRFGEGRGKDAATIAGTLLGGSLGRDIAKNNSKSYKTKERHCEVSHDNYEVEHIVGYNVTYRYHGGIYRTYMDHHPHSRVRVKVSVSLAE